MRNIITATTEIIHDPEVRVDDIARDAVANIADGDVLDLRANRAAWIDGIGQWDIGDVDPEAIVDRMIAMTADRVPA